MVLEDKSGERFTELWFLTDSWSQEAKWVQGRVPISIEGPTEDFQYKVSINMETSQAKKIIVVLVQKWPFSNSRRQNSHN